MLYFGEEQPDHGPSHIRKVTDLTVGQKVVVHTIINHQPVATVTTVTAIDQVKYEIWFDGWEGGDSFADLGLQAYEEGDSFLGQEMMGLFHQAHWLERLTGEEQSEE